MDLQDKIDHLSIEEYEEHQGEKSFSLFFHVQSNVYSENLALDY